ncbi:MAG: gas vesicle protein [Chloroflexi bacterium]|nr:gas vesicle protein [Chloroflexota bacterium]
MELRDVLEGARTQLASLTGLKPVCVSRVFKDGQCWHVGVEMLEMSRIPPSADLLGDYEVILAEDGNMMRFERKRTRLRGEAVETGSR